MVVGATCPLSGKTLRFGACSGCKYYLDIWYPWFEPGDTVLWYGTYEVAAGPQQVCRFLVPGLVVGGAYDFVVQDEVNQFWEAYGVRVTPFAAEAIRMSLAGVTLAFASLPERGYEIQWARRLGDPWLTVTNVVSQGERTTVVVRHPDRASPTGFFRIRMLNTD